MHPARCSTPSPHPGPLELDVRLQEPPKAEMLAWYAGRGPLPARMAQVILLVPRREEVVEVLVRLQNDLRIAGAAPNDMLKHWKKVRGWGQLAHGMGIWAGTMQTVVMRRRVHSRCALLDWQPLCGCANSS
jgi:hypothetical protein